MLNEARLFRLFEDLCAINAPPLMESDCVSFARRFLADNGLEVWEDDAGKRLGGNANNLIAKLPGNSAGAPSIFFSAHFDTVEPTAGLEIELRDDVYYSKSDTILGADDKAGMAPAIEAVLSVKEANEPHGDVYLVLSVAEEIGLKGAFACEIESLGVDFGYVFDTGPPVGSFVTKVGTQDKIHALVKGKPAHAGKDPEHGINAIQAAAAGIAKMRVGRLDGDTTANVGLISGGTATNVVPAEVAFWMEARSMNLADLDAQVEHMIACVQEGAKQYGATAEISKQRMYEGYDIPKETSVVQIGLEAASNLGFDFPLRCTLGGSDANAFNAKGVPTIVAGTGMKEIHTHDEHVAKKDLVDLARLAVEIIRVSNRGART